MSRFILDGIEFKRTIFHFRGHVEGEEDISGSRVYIIDSRTKREVDIEVYKTEGNRVRGIIDVMEIENCYPLDTGHWFFRIALPGGQVLTAYAGDDIYDRVYMMEMDDVQTDLIIDKGADNYWYGLSTLKKGSWEYYLAVDFSVPVKKNSIFHRWGVRIKKRMSKIRDWVYRQLFRFFNSTVTKKGNKVFFTSDRTPELSGNEKFVYDRMIERGLGDKYEFRFDFKDGIGAYRSFADKFRFVYNLATSDYIFLDDYQPEIYKNDYDPDVKLIQLWHACGAFKSVGFERLGAKGAPGFMTRAHKSYTHVLVSSDVSADHNAEAFALPRDRFYPVGIARTDVFFDEGYKARTREKVYEQYPVLKKAKQVIIYAPTFRGNGAKTAFFPMQLINFEMFGPYLVEHDGVMIVKMHPFVKERIEIPEKYADRFIDATDYPDINELLMVSDLLITDYSSVIYEMALLRKPMIFFAFDLKSYTASRGFYESYEDTVPGKIVTTLRGLIMALEDEDYEFEKMEGFLKKNFKYLDGHSTDRAIDLIFGREDGNSLAPPISEEEMAVIK